MVVLGSRLKKVLSLMLVAVFLFGVVVPVQASSLPVNNAQGFEKLLNDIDSVLNNTQWTASDMTKLVNNRNEYLNISSKSTLKNRLQNDFKQGTVYELDPIILGYEDDADKLKFNLKVITAFGADLATAKAELAKVRQSFDALMPKLTAKNVGQVELYNFFIELDKELYKELKDVTEETLNAGLVTAVFNVLDTKKNIVPNLAAFLEPKEDGFALLELLTDHNFLEIYNQVKGLFIEIYKKPENPGGGNTGGSGSSGGAGGGGSDTPREPKEPELFDPKKPIFSPLSELEVFPVDLGKDSSVKFGQALSLNIPAGAVNLPAGAKAEVYVQELDPKDLREQLEEKHKDAKHLDIVGPILSIEFATQVGGQLQKVTDFSKPITLEIDLSNVDLEKVNPKKLGFWRIDETGKMTGVGGKLDKEKKVFTVTRTSFSTYAILEYNKSFKDMEKHWAQTEIEELAAKGIIQGITDTDFDPKGSVTRAQFASMLVRTLGLEGEVTSNFKDVKESDWYFKAVNLAAANGLVGGYGDNSFKPGQEITREEMAFMMAKAFKFLGKEIAINTETELAQYKDKAELKAWARESIAIVSQQGLMAGQTGEKFVPQAKASRAEAAVVINRLWNKL